MTVLTVEESNQKAAAVPRNRTRDASESERAWDTDIRDELTHYLVTMSEWSTLDNMDVLASIASIHARLAHIRVELQRSGQARHNALRTREVDPLMDAVEFQFKVRSRMVTLVEAEWKMAGGAL